MLEEYQKNCLQYLHQISPDFRGKIILEIGTGNSLDIADYCIEKGAQEFWCTDIFQSRPNGIIKDKIYFEAVDVCKNNFQNNYFDIAIGSAVLEHIEDIERVKVELLRIVKPDGSIMLHGSPFWFCKTGHHIYKTLGEKNYFFNDPDCIVPPFSHLYFSEKEMYEYLEDHIDKEHVKEICKWIYHSKEINRIYPEEIISVFNSEKRFSTSFHFNSSEFSKKEIVNIDRKSYPAFYTFNWGELWLKIKKKENNESKKISIITVSYNNESRIEKSINSVLNQEYFNFEHIIIDRGSNDETMNILKKYPHLSVGKDPGLNKLSAINRGFRLASGDIIVVLDANAVFERNIFCKILSMFEDGYEIVLGDFQILNDNGDSDLLKSISEYNELLEYWELDDNLTNRVGPFYSLKIKKTESFGENDYNYELSYLLNSIKMNKAVKLDDVIGSYFIDTTKSNNEKLSFDYWEPKRYQFIKEHYLKWSKERKSSYILAETNGLQYRRSLIEDECNLNLKNNVIYFPEKENEVGDDLVINNIHPVFEKGSIILVLNPAKVASQSITLSLSKMREETLDVLVYHLHSISRCQNLIKNRLMYERGKKHFLVGMEIKRILDRNPNILINIITGMREPIAHSLSNIFEAYHRYPQLQDNSLDFEGAIKNILSNKWLETYFDKEIYDGFGINIYDYTFNKKKGYSIIRNKNVNILLYKYESLSDIYSSAVKEFLNIENLELPLKNMGNSKEKPYSDLYDTIKKTLKLDKKYLKTLYSSMFVSYFYSKNEIDNFINMWERY